MTNRTPYRVFRRFGPRKGLTETVRHLSETLAQKLGRPASDDEIARLLAINPRHVTRARGGKGGAA